MASPCRAHEVSPAFPPGGLDGGHVDGADRATWLSAHGRGAAATVATPPGAHAQAPKRGGILKHIGLAPPTFDIHATISHETQLMSSFVRRTLFKFVNGARHGPSDSCIIYTPNPRNVSSWAPRVKNYGPKNSLDRGAQLEGVWIDKA